MRSSRGGCVEKRWASLRPLKGFTMNMWAVFALACMGRRRAWLPSFSSASAREPESPR
jgi:hypothetical protein